MLTFLLVSLLIHGTEQFCGTTTTFTERQRQELLNTHNKYRTILARGTPYGRTDVHPAYQPGSQKMFELKYSCELEKIAELSTAACEKSSHPPGTSVNFFKSIRFPFAGAMLPLIATRSWYKQVYDYGLDQNATFSNPKMEEFANMMFYKSTEMGCSFKDCTLTSALACVYNSAPTEGGPIFIPGGRGCVTDVNCSSALANATCNLRGINWGTCAAK